MLSSRIQSFGNTLVYPNTDFGTSAWVPAFAGTTYWRNHLYLCSKYLLQKLA